MENEIVLQIGMSDENGQVTVVDEDRLCYRVRNKAKGAVGIRTISKDLLKEWVDAVRKYPQKSSQDLRDELKGTSDVDKFEYGYFSTLKLLADMVLGAVNITHSPGMASVSATGGQKLLTQLPTPYAGTAELKFKKDDKDDELLLRIMAALKAKPFVILAGHSGTGKSRFAKKLAYMTCNAEDLREKGKLPGNLLMLQVKPNWHDSTELLGYRNAIDKNRWQKTALTEFIFKAYHFPETPFILCLDEMNLAPVEQYFAEFLSAMESKEPVPIADINAEDDNLFELGCKWTDSLDVLKQSGFSIPKNLFIIGTVNMDETTNQFSRKVLDRAFTIEMTDVDFTSFGSVKTPCYEDTIKEDPIKELLKCDEEVTKLDDDDKDSNSALNAVQQALKNTPFAIAYRFAAEYTLLKRALEKFDVAEDPNERIGLDALDQAVLMKVLPRIAGEADYIRESVYGMDNDYKNVKSVGLMQALGAEVPGAQSKTYNKKEKSIAKINEILLRAKATGAMAINFWP